MIRPAPWLIPFGILGVVAWAPFAAIACDGPGAVRDATPATLAQQLRSQRKEVLTFLGYSAAGYESPQQLQQHLAGILAGRDPARTLISAGGTEDGIGAVYALAKARGFETIGIVSSLAREKKVPLAGCADVVFFVKDASWGGKVAGSDSLSPTSAAIVASSDAFVAIGGGDVARDEALAARRAGKPVLYIPAEMNHRLAKEKAQKQGRPIPTDFRGALAPLFPQPDPQAP